MKRMDYINWDEYFMGIALLTAMRSKDPNSQVGACIVSSENKILSLGYNGMPIGCSDDEMPWEREGAPLDTKYMYVCHAELNAILNSAHNNLKGARVYVGLHILRVGSWLEHSIVSTHKKEPSQSCSSERVLFVLTCPCGDSQATCTGSVQLPVLRQPPENWLEWCP